MSNKKNDVIISKKKDFRKFIEYLVDSYYLCPNQELNLLEIKQELNINRSPVIDNFMKYLKKNKYIKYKLFDRENFTITFIGFQYLESLQNINKETENNITSIIMATIALIATIVCGLYDNVIIKSITSILLIAILWKSTTKILKKEYY